MPQMSDSKVIGFLAATESQTRANSSQAIGMMAASDRNLSATLVGDPQAGSKQIPPEDAHHKIMELLRLEIALNLHKILAEEIKGVGDQDYTDLIAIMTKLSTALNGSSSFMADAKARLTASRGQLADVLQTNSVHMDSGNSVEILTANEFRILRTVMWRAGTAIRWEAPLIVDSAHTRIMLAHTMLQEAELLTQRAVSLMASIKEVYGVTAQELALIAQDKAYLQGDTLTLVGKTHVKIDSGTDLQVTVGGMSISMTGTRVDINPTTPPTPPTSVDATDLNSPGYRTRAKKHLELPQFDGMSPIPAYVTPDDEVVIQKDGEAGA